MEPLSVDEVKQAIKKLNRGKNRGPNHLPNELYLDHADSIAPSMAVLFNSVLQTNQVPSYFGKAHVYYIPKLLRPETGLDCRPIALPNSDYKIITKLMATRLAVHMKRMIHESQNGFARGRVIHDTIDIFFALQKLVLEGKAPRDAIALFLDFKNAYDSLDRTFLRRALIWHQLPQPFIDIIMALHAHSTASFLANGYVSEQVEMENRIRQGCPLA